MQYICLSFSYMILILFQNLTYNFEVLKILQQILLSFLFQPYNHYPLLVPFIWQFHYIYKRFKSKVFIQLSICIHIPCYGRFIIVLCLIHRLSLYKPLSVPHFYTKRHKFAIFYDSPIQQLFYKRIANPLKYQATSPQSPPYQ